MTSTPALTAKRRWAEPTSVSYTHLRPKHQKYIAVSIEGQQASPSKGQAKRLRELDKENKLSPDVIDGILCEEKKKEDRDVIITGAELRCV